MPIFNQTDPRLINECAAQITDAHINAFHRTWETCAADAHSAIGKGLTNKDALELCLDANRLCTVGGAPKELEDELLALLDQYPLHVFMAALDRHIKLE